MGATDALPHCRVVLSERPSLFGEPLELAGRVGSVVAVTEGDSTVAPLAGQGVAAKTPLSLALPRSFAGMDRNHGNG